MMAKSRRIICIFRFCAILGLCLLIGGAVAIMIGYVEPRDSISIALKRHQVTVNDDGDLLISAEVINRLKDDKLKHWKLVGLITFAMGGIFLVKPVDFTAGISLLIPSCAKMCGHSTFISELNSPNEPPIKIYQQTDEENRIAGSMGAEGAPPRSPTEKMVPTVEQVTTVQPDEKKLRRTSAGNEDAMLLLEELAMIFNDSKQYLILHNVQKP
uniref:Uncharacterized protein n=1 Tax=Romanomermis culicivorax TaxID=13658 RepID=A0A915KVV4_ROMCU